MQSCVTGVLCCAVLSQPTIIGCLCRVPCPHCGRRFAELVAERHIPKCVDIRAKPGRLMAAGGRGAHMRSGGGAGGRGGGGGVRF